MIATKQLFVEDNNAKSCKATVVAITENGGIILDQTVFYATSGGQPGDSGALILQDGRRLMLDTAAYEKGDKSVIIHLPCEEALATQALPQVGDEVTAEIDWPRRSALTRMHTACHILSVVCPYPITGAGVGENESRIDFDMAGMDIKLDKQAITAAMMDIVKANHTVFTRWISEEELDANPDLVRSKNVKPPRGLGKIRLVCIGEDGTIDSQPCGGTHVNETQEIGDIHIGKIENKGRENRRVRIRFGPLPSA